MMHFYNSVRGDVTQTGMRVFAPADALTPPGRRRGAWLLALGRQSGGSLGTRGEGPRATEKREKRNRRI